MLIIGGKFKLNDDALENYGEEYRDRIFTVSEVFTSSNENPYYDEGMDGMALYESEELNFAVYEWEVEEV